MNQSSFIIALTGNPNAGKTSLYNAFTGARKHVGNYPGVTVDKTENTIFQKGESIKIVDLPGTYSLTAYSLEEITASNYLIRKRPDVVIDVLDASNLERNLYLAVQLLELGIPLILCLNMIDVAEERGMRINPNKLTTLLNVPVVFTVARKGQGVQKLLSTAIKLAREKRPWHPLAISYGSDIDAGLKKLTTLLENFTHPQNLLSARWLALKCLEDDSEILKIIHKNPQLKQQVVTVCRGVATHIKNTMDDDPENIIADYRYGFISAIIKQALVNEREIRLDFSDKVDKILTNKLFGPLFLLGILYAIYQFVFRASEKPAIWLEIIFSWLGIVAESFLPEGLLRSLIVSGVIHGLGGVMGFVPLIMFMFFAIAIMEDSGYMARISYLMDRVLRTFGLHGNSVIALIVGGGLSGGCAVPGIMATRTIKDPQARLATILVVPFMNCGAKLPVYSLLIGAFFTTHRAEIMMILTILSWALAMLTARILRSTILKGEHAPFVMELPPYRTPTIKGLLIHTWERTWQYIKKASTILLIISIVMWALMTFPGLNQERQKYYTNQLEQTQNNEQKKKIINEQIKENLQATIAGHIGEWLTIITNPLGFDWQTNVALLSGLAAKEVIVTSLGTACSLSESSSKKNKQTSLSEKLQFSNGWSPLRAFVLMLFVMIYSPCIATLTIIWRETNTLIWPIFLAIYTTTLAYSLTFLVYQCGKTLIT